MPADIKIDDFFKREALYIQNGFACGDWNDVGRGVIQLRPFNVSGNGEIDLSAAKFVEVERDLRAYLLKANDVIFNNTNSEELVGKTALWTKDQKAVLSNHMTIVRVLKEDLLSPQFVAFYLLKKWMDGYFHQVCRRHVNQASVSIERLKDTPFPDFDVSEQRRIAHILATAQTAIEQQARLIALTRELKAALMRKLFTEGLHGEKQKETDIGLVPESWEQLRLEKAGDVIYGIQAAVANNLQPIGMKILTNKNITLDGQIVLDEINYFELKTKRHFETVLKKGDILFNWRSGSKEHIGKTAYFNLDGEYTHSSFILRIRPNANVNGRFLFWYLYFLRASGYFLQKHDVSSVNATFNKSAVDALSVFLPSKDEQEEIASVLDTVDAKIALLKQRRDVQEELFRTLLHQLMTGQTRVNEIDLPGLS